MAICQGEFAVTTRRKANNKGTPLAVKKPDAHVESETARLIQFMFSYNPKGKRRPVCVNGRQSPPWAYASDAFPSNLVEFVYHPDVYKTRMCPDGEKCREPREKCGYLHPHEVFLPPWRCQGLVVDGYWYPPEPVTYEWFRFLMLEFKTGDQPCRLKRDHDLQRCPYWHAHVEPSDRRAPVLLNTETGRWVPLPNNSPLTAVRFHPLLYKRQACIFIEGQREKCIRGRYCTHSHLGDEIVLIPRYLEKLKQELLKPMGNPLPKIISSANFFASDGYPSPPLSSVSSTAHSPPLSPRHQAQSLMGSRKQSMTSTDTMLDCGLAPGCERSGRQDMEKRPAVLPSPHLGWGAQCKERFSGFSRANMFGWDSLGPLSLAGSGVGSSGVDCRVGDMDWATEESFNDIVPTVPVSSTLRMAMAPDNSTEIESDTQSMRQSFSMLPSRHSAMSLATLNSSTPLDSPYSHLCAQPPNRNYEQPFTQSLSYELNGDGWPGYALQKRPGDWKPQHSMFSHQSSPASNTQPLGQLWHSEGGEDRELGWTSPQNSWSAFGNPVWSWPQNNAVSNFSASLNAKKYDEWSADDVLRWAQSHSDPTIRAAGPILRANDIDGSLLLSLDDLSLRDMDMTSFGMRAKTLAAISKLQISGSSQ